MHNTEPWPATKRMLEGAGYRWLAHRGWNEILEYRAKLNHAEQDFLKETQHKVAKALHWHSITEKAKAALQSKQDAVEELKRRKRLAQGKKNKTVKKHAYSAPVEPEVPELQECSVHGCMQRLKLAERALREAEQRAKIRQDTAEIARCEARGAKHPLSKQRASESKAKAEAKRIQTYRKEQKHKSKEVRAEERKLKSMDKQQRRAGADLKYRAAY